MDDLISRQAAIDELVRWGKIPDYSDKEKILIGAVIGMLSSLPSVQPEQSSEIQDILEYLDTVLHPIISPDYWNVYSELHDMISMLPSA